jgi:hypothetical protein
MSANAKDDHAAEPRLKVEIREELVYLLGQAREIGCCPARGGLEDHQGTA